MAFRATMTTVLGVLAVLCAVLVAVTALQGPAVRVAVDLAAPGTPILHLDRADPAEDPGGPDRIVRTALDGSGAVTVYSGPRVQAFTTVGSRLAVATLDDDGESSIGIADPADPGRIEPLPLPVAGTVGRMEGRDPSSVLVFTLTAAGQDVPEPVSVLYAVDLDRDDVPRPVPGLDGEPLAVTDWTVLDGGDRVAALAAPGLLLVDVAGDAPPVPFGRYATLAGLSVDGTDLAVTDAEGWAAVAVSDGTARRMRSAPVTGEEAPAVYGVQLLSGIPVGDDPGALPRVEQVAAYDPAAGRYVNRVVRTDGTSSRTLFEAADDRTFVLGFSVSPDGRHAAIAFVTGSDAPVSDGYAADPYPTAVRTVVVDIATAGRIGEVAGVGVDW